MLPLPPVGERDVVGKDIHDIPRVVEWIQTDPEKQNTLTFWTMARVLCKRLHARADKDDGSIDVLLTGCETSLWVAEQFASGETEGHTRA